VLPNMTWVIGRGGTILYKADWTSAANVEAFLTRYEEGRRRKPASGAVAPYMTEQIEFRDVDREEFYARLRRNGQRAYDEFKRAEEIWSSRR
ncbi:MAG: deiodinase-related protein, partial [Nitriliruptorales bacterium]|nr:deiodinase-related protein [Nitriliruptorales bacterium]